MPLYEYVCNNCHSHFDALVSLRDRSRDVACRDCDSSNVRRLVSGFAMVGGYDDQFVPRQSGNGGGGGCCGGSCGCGH